MCCITATAHSLRAALVAEEHARCEQGWHEQLQAAAYRVQEAQQAAAAYRAEAVGLQGTLERVLQGNTMDVEHQKQVGVDVEHQQQVGKEQLLQDPGEALVEVAERCGIQGWHIIQP